MKLFYVNMQYTYSYSVVYSLNRRGNHVHIMRVLHQTHFCLSITLQRLLFLSLSFTVHLVFLS